jgi:hypothetical protein
MLDQLLGLLDKPREALYNTVEGLSEGDFGKALPGLLGIAGGGLAATGVGLPLAIALGSGIGGLAQSRFGQKAATPDEALARVIGQDNVDTTGGKLGSLLLGAATDPTTYAGFGLGRRAGAALGRGLDRTAEALGPRYGTTAADVSRMLDEYVPKFQAQQMEKYGQMVPEQNLERVLRPFYEAVNSPGAGRILSEINPQSSILGHGIEGFATQAPTGGVTRVARTPKVLGRPIEEGLLQPTRTVGVPSWSPSGYAEHSVEQLPFATGVGQVPQSAVDELVQSIGARGGLGIRDTHPMNLGFHEGRPVIIDPGSVYAYPEFAGGRNPVIPGADTSRGLLHRLLGSDRAMQQAVEQGLANPGYADIYRRKLGLLGGLGGALPLGQRPSEPQ